MALVIVTGLPCSGRTTRAKEIQRAFQARIAEFPSLGRVVRVSDDDVHTEKQAFDSQRTEKSARAAYLSAVRRALDHKSIVIADGGAGLNIKGYRYELWCAARELGIRCATELCRTWNAERIATGAVDAYTPTGLDELIARFEEPTPASRWHRPLFVMTTTQGDAGIDVSPTPLDDLWHAVTQAEVQAPKVVTAQRHATSNNSLELLDGVTQRVVAALQEQRANTPQGTVQLAVAGLAPVSLTLPAGRAFPTPARLQTLRRQFVRVYASKSEFQDLGLAHAAPEQQVAQLFAAWLQETLAS
ncbi:kti12, chromatin associated [Malassezia brasiliensis]|uniref:Kti12, chromatin associated n=1 Tax=Malassezia brasiliensis TaxID=1821822 RepID=A0AAF0IPM6_9BASI|nr:kti12, chromatin associated [Malassezia brasiliensis]